MSIPPLLNQEQQFTGWMACFHTLMMKPLPLVGAASGAAPLAPPAAAAGAPCACSRVAG